MYTTVMGPNKTLWIARWWRPRSRGWKETLLGSWNLHVGSLYPHSEVKITAHLTCWNCFCVRQAEQKKTASSALPVSLSQGKIKHWSVPAASCGCSFLHPPSRQCRGASLSPWEIWVLIISGKCCAEADNFVTAARRVEELHWTLQGKHFIHVWIPRLFAASRGRGANQGRSISHGCFALEMPRVMGWWSGTWQKLLFYFVYGGVFLFVLRWIKVVKITSCNRASRWSISSPSATRWMWNID